MTLNACLTQLASEISMAQDSRGGAIIREYKGHLIALNSGSTKRWAMDVPVSYS